MNNDLGQAMRGTQTPQHFSFVLRLWQSGEVGGSSWQASLENPDSRKRVGFTSLEQLFAYLMDISDGHDDKPDIPQSNRA